MGNKQDFFLKLDLVSFVRGTRERSGWLGSLETLWKIFLSCFSKISLWIFEVYLRLKQQSGKALIWLMSYARKSRHYTRKSVPRGSFPLRLLLLRMFLWCLLQIPARNINSGLTLSLLSPRSTFSHRFYRLLYHQYQKSKAPLGVNEVAKKIATIFRLNNALIHTRNCTGDFYWPMSVCAFASFTCSHRRRNVSAVVVANITVYPLVRPSSESTFSQTSKEECISEVVRNC